MHGIQVRTLAAIINRTITKMALIFYLSIRFPVINDHHCMYTQMCYIIIKLIKQCSGLITMFTDNDEYPMSLHHILTNTVKQIRLGLITLFAVILIT